MTGAPVRPYGVGMNMMKLLVLLGALLACACNTGAYTVAVKDDSLRNDAVTAIAAWDASLGVSCPDVHLYLVDDPALADITIEWASRPGYEDLAGTERDGRIAVARDKARLYPETMPAVIAHELGHAMGLDHSRDKASIMHAGLDPDRGPEPTALDVAHACNGGD